MSTSKGYSFEFTKDEARKFIVACKKLNLNPEQEISKAMTRIIDLAKEKDSKLFINHQEQVFKQRNLTFDERREYVNAIKKASGGRLSEWQASNLSRYFYGYAKAVYNDKKQLQNNGVQRLTEWIWYEYSTNPFKYNIEEWK